MTIPYRHRQDIMQLDKIGDDAHAKIVGIINKAEHRRKILSDPNWRAWLEKIQVSSLYYYTKLAAKLTRDYWKRNLK
jgi:hypothetical protein